VRYTPAQHLHIKERKLHTKERKRAMASPTLRELTGMSPNPAPISDSALVLIDCQRNR
jgi:hypothetical protein